MSGAASRHEALTPAAEWLHDNFHIVEGQLAETKRDLPDRYYAHLPKLGGGDYAGYPRVYALMRDLVTYSVGALDVRDLLDYVDDYQKTTPLQIGEIWAIPIMLRVSLLENLACLVAPLEAARQARLDADGWAADLVLAAAERPADVAVLLGELARRQARLTGAHVVRLIQRIRGRGSLMAPVLSWLAAHVEARSRCGMDDFVRSETQTQATDQVAISNTIGCFRLLDQIDWNDFFETASLLEARLRSDEVYADSDFSTRDACRHAVERIARGSQSSEENVCSTALSLAAERTRSPPEAVPVGGDRPHPGFDPRSVCAPYYLIDDGLHELQERLGYRPGTREVLVMTLRKHPGVTYMGGIGTIWLTLIGLALVAAHFAGGGAGLLILTAAAGFLPSGDLAIAVVNWFITRMLPPRVLPKRELASGIPAGCRTLVAVPVLLVDAGCVDGLLARLESHYLTNPDPNLRFALLTDHLDAPTESTPADLELLEQAKTGVALLNERHGSAERPGPFHLIHRNRHWNASQRCWMGWERKRGKLVEVNRWLRGRPGTTISTVVGDPEGLRDIRYVLCLDSDTRLPPEAARRLVATLSHPLNAPELDRTLQRVVRGYSVLQPRVSITLTSSARSLFTRVFSGNAGFDPYTMAASDVYQDLFGEGVFCGKGLYEIDTFQSVLEGWIVDNTLLSHDLLEGCFARCGLVTDVELFDDYPVRYDSCSSRQHRWIRGDWQLLHWLLPKVLDRDGAHVPNPLSLVSRWKILDNLRRSLIAPGLLALLLCGWLVLPGSGMLWTFLALAAVAVPIWVHIAGAMLFDPRAVRWGSYFWNVWDDLRTNTQQVALSLTFLPHQAFVSIDAIGRTLGRMFGTGHDLLEWQSAAQTEQNQGARQSSFWRRMWSVSLFAAIGLIAVAFVRPQNLPAATPLLLLWGISPFLAYVVSLPIRQSDPSLTPAQRSMLFGVARRTWRFFQESVTEADGWLPPDNLQPERPEPLAHRTSPTNIGLLLLATLAARDFGYLGLLEMIERLEKTMGSLAGLGRYRGHLYNWYDTVGQSPLNPLYVSTVDSGNLAGHLLTVKQACLAICDEPAFGDRTIPALQETLELLRGELPARNAALGDSCRELARAIDGLRGSIDPGARASVSSAALRLSQSVREAVPQAADECVAWSRLLADQAGELHREANSLLAWAEPLLSQPKPSADGRPLRGSEDASERAHVCGALTEALATGQASPSDFCELLADALAEVECLRDGCGELQPPWSSEFLPWLNSIQEKLECSLAHWRELVRRSTALAESADRLFSEMDFRFLYDGRRDLFFVGYDVAEARMDSSHYDLLASECRLASFLAIAKGDVPQKHWFRLGRGITRAYGQHALLSWGGTMFEYLMPSLVMRAYPGTLLAHTLPSVVERQRRFAAREKVPWGISESGYSAQDQLLNYQYRSFGVPGLGLNPALFDDLVVAPYATLLALPISPRRAVENLEALIEEGLCSPLGFYEAIDYTPSRMKPGRRSEVVRQYMAHHQGMALVSLGNTLLDAGMPERFHSDPLVRSAELLLEERNPRPDSTMPASTQHLALSHRRVREAPPSAVRHYSTAQTSTPRVQLLSNGHYGVMLTSGGGGFSSWDGRAVSRWREDATRDHWGQFIYVRDLLSGEYWSIAHHPVCAEAEAYDVRFTDDKAEFERRGNRLIQRLEATVSWEDDVEIRRVTITNLSDQARELEVSSYLEVVLAPASDDLAHPAFGKLFVETEYVPSRNALLATRRPRSAHEPRLWAVHVLAHEGTPEASWRETDYETDRAAFLGRGRTPRTPRSMEKGRSASRTVGPVLDPILSLSQGVRLGPRQTIQMAFVTGIAATREEALVLAERYRDLRCAERSFELAWLHSRIELRHLNLTLDQAGLSQRLASRLLYADSHVRAPEETLARSTLDQSGLWPYGISGDLPVVLARVSSSDHIALVRELLLAHSYLRRKGLPFDLVILNEHPPGYLQPFEQALRDAIRNEGSATDRPGGVFLRRADLITDAARNLLEFAARAVFSGLHGPLSHQLDWRPEPRSIPARRYATRTPSPSKPQPQSHAELEGFNGVGGFSREAREYCILLDGDHWTPAPWANVVANPRFGFVATESGAGFTWESNSRENRLTPWANDPVTDPQGEVVFLRDEGTGRFWSTTPLPRCDDAPYIVAHGTGYTRYVRRNQGVDHELLITVPLQDPVKIYRLNVRNRTDKPLDLTATLYAEWVLGAAREQTQAFVTTWADESTRALFARNAFSPEFGARVAFADASIAERSWTCDRTEFLGRNGSLDRPRAMLRTELSGRAGAALDPCAAIRVPITLPPGGEVTLHFTLGQGADEAEARDCLLKYRRSGALTVAQSEVSAFWDSFFGAIRVRTPDPSFDRLMNEWLLYQVMACRVNARSAFYQSGGAYGFRDQLQDVMALVTAGCPEGVEVARRQILLHASRQFPEGDVQHWWHPPSGRGVRTRFSDDLLWLPYATSHYVHTTGDTTVLDERVPFLLGRPLAEGEDEYYDLPSVANETASLYDHCVRAIRRATTAGSHGLPLMGTGDWNDGMNRVGREGRGESVWLAWFLVDVLRRFSALSAARGDCTADLEFRERAERYRVAIEEHAWDGEWYLRAYYDNGTPMGSARNEECRIDSIAQSWAVISSAGDPDRCSRAMDAVDEWLVKEDAGLILLFTPPFDNSGQDPGYVKGYVPGVRENGGQYTHAALWTVMATALLGRGGRAHELFALLNPINRSSTQERCGTYRVEPYVVAADVYAGEQNVGCGGWSWYTGSASWMYRIGIETLLGFHRNGDSFAFEPRIPASWPGFELRLKFGATTYDVCVRNPNGVETGIASVTLDGETCMPGSIPILTDGHNHTVSVIMAGAGQS